MLILNNTEIVVCVVVDVSSFIFGAVGWTLTRMALWGMGMCFIFVEFCCGRKREMGNSRKEETRK